MYFANGNVVNNCTTTYCMIYILVVTQPDFYLMNMHSVNEDWLAYKTWIKKSRVKRRALQRRYDFYYNAKLQGILIIYKFFYSIFFHFSVLLAKELQWEHF